MMIKRIFFLERVEYKMSETKSKINKLSFALFWIGFVLLEIFTVKHLFSAYETTECLIVYLILLCPIIMVLLMYLIIYWMLLEEQRKKFSLISVIMLIFIALLYGMDYHFEKQTIEEKNVVEKMVLEFSDYNTIPTSLYANIHNQGFQIYSEDVANGKIIHRKRDVKHGKDIPTYFVDKELRYFDINEYCKNSEIDKYIQEQIIQKINGYDEITGTYYSPLGNSYITVQEFDNRKVLQMEAYPHFKYLIKPDMSYTKIQ